MHRFGVAVVVLGLCAGCDTTITDEGRFCIGSTTASDPPITIAENERIVVTVIYGDCLSGCASGSGHCTVEQNGTKLVVHSEFTYDEGGGPGVSCADVCTSLTTKCSSGPLAAGSYTVTHGAHEMTLAVPSTLMTDTDACSK